MALSKTLRTILEAIEVAPPNYFVWWIDNKPEVVKVTHYVYKNYLNKLVSENYLRKKGLYLEYTGKDYIRPKVSQAEKGWLNNLRMVAHNQAQNSFQITKTSVQKKIDERTTTTIDMAIVSFTSKPLSPEEAETLIIEIAKTLNSLNKKE